MKRFLSTLFAALPVAAGGNPEKEAKPEPPRRKAETASVRPSGPPGADYRKPSLEELRRQLTRLQFQVAYEDGTEPPFQNEYWDNHAEGLYVDVVSGDPLFSSMDKYDSGTGWPSFTRPIEPDRIVTGVDRQHGMTRTEVRSRLSDSHLGHVFEDGPAPTRLRYCMNSAALRFIPAVDLEEEGYGQYLRLFRKQPDGRKRS